ncbi:unnamed protein product [Sphagnum jensenii]|uniref:Uncharacterized protein n=1 Tax=Sphagnum jensenii TaxID=128206 RepID=A0ABP1APR4_9BRYO
MDCLMMTTGCTSARSQLLVMGMAAMTVFLAMTLFFSPLQYSEAAEVECVLPIPTEMRVCVNCRPVPEGSAAATAVPSISNGDCLVVMLLPAGTKVEIQCHQLGEGTGSTIWYKVCGVDASTGVETGICGYLQQADVRFCLPSDIVIPPCPC